MYKRTISILCACALLGAAPLEKPAPGGSAWTQAQINALGQTIRRDLSASTLRGAQVGLVVRDTVRGTVLYSQNADQDFMPASNFKLLVGSAALQ